MNIQSKRQLPVSSAIQEDAETRGHNLLQAPSFPLKSIGDTGPWFASRNQYNHFGKEPNTYVGLHGDVRLWQDVELPVKANGSSGKRPLYRLGCEYDATNFNACTVSVYELLDDGTESKELYKTYVYGDPLKQPPEGASEDWPADADPTWQVLELGEIQVPADARRVRVVFETPPANGSTRLFLTRVRNELSLPALGKGSNIRLVLDPEDLKIEQILKPEEPLLFCLGAQHHLYAEPGITDSWKGQKASLLWRDPDASPEQYGLTSAPPFNIRDRDEEEDYGELPGHWSVYASGKAERSGEVQLRFGSYHTAEVYSVPVNLGNHYRVVTEVGWNKVAPIIELGNSTQLTATVKSPFTNQALEGVEVEWLAGEKLFDSTLTDSSGQAIVDYVPDRGDVSSGKARVRAVVRNPVKGSSELSIEVPVFEESPLVEGFDLYLDGKLISKSSTTRHHFLRHASRTFMLKPKQQGNYLVGERVRLHFADPSEPDLGIVLPDDSKEIVEQGVTWEVKGGGDSGLFIVQFSLEGDGAYVPPISVYGAQYSADLHDEVDLFFDGKEQKEPHVIFPKMAQSFKVVPKAGSPVGGLELSCAPVFESIAGKQRAEHFDFFPGDVTTLTDRGFSKKIMTTMALYGICRFGISSRPLMTAWSKECWVFRSADLRECASFRVDGSLLADGFTFEKNKTYDISLYAPYYSDDVVLGNFLLEGWLESSVSPDAFEPKAGERMVLDHDRLVWRFTAPENSETVTFKIYLEHFDAPLETRHISIR